MEQLKKQIAEKVLDYWFILEFLGQDKYPDSSEIQTKVKKLKQEVRKTNSEQKQINDFLYVTEKDDIYHAVSAEANECGMDGWGSLTFYVGKIQREACIETIAKKLLVNRKDLPEKSGDEIAWFAFQISSTGQYVEHTFSLSPILWSIKRIKRNMDKVFDYLGEEAYIEEVKQIEERFFRQDTKEITISMVKEIYRYVFEHYIKDEIEIKGQEEENSVMQEVYGISFQLFKNQDYEYEMDFGNYSGLSSDYFSNDIKMVLEKLRKNEFTQDFIDYIVAPYEDFFSNTKPCRVDLVNPEDKEVFKNQINEILDVNNAPLGKWPSKYMPAFMQQIAINFAIGKKENGLFGKNGKVFSVNGPPGTGKTTLLKEIVVSNVVERAILLAQYTDPDAAFEEHYFLHGTRDKNSYSKFTQQWYSLKNEKINDFGILVTSCNNAAVENISKELPLGTSILKDLASSDSDREDAKSSLKSVRDLFDVTKSNDIEKINRSDSAQHESPDIYFTEYAKMLFHNEDVWGLIAAPLGKKSNINHFYYQVLNPLLWDFYPKNATIEARKAKYVESRNEFQTQLKKVQDMQKKLHVYFEIAERRAILIRKADETEIKNSGLIASCREQIEKHKREYAKFQDCLNEITQKKEHQNQTSDEIQQEQAHLENQYAEIRSKLISLREQTISTQNSVGVFCKVFNKRKYEDVQKLADFYRSEADQLEIEMERLKLKLAELQDNLSGKQSQCNTWKDEENRLKTNQKEHEEQISKLAQDIEFYEYEIDTAKNAAKNVQKDYEEIICYFVNTKSINGGVVIDDEFVSRILSTDIEEATKAQVSNPWFTQKYNREREKLFFYAMKLNKEFVLSSKACRNNLKSLAHYWGLAKGDEKEKITFHKEDSELCVGALYQTLLLLVPVISSTFASVGSFLKDIKRPGVIGTLIIDEAGQARPQMALGALYRSRKAIIVGDPKQVEPVVTDDLKLLREIFSADLYKPYKSKSMSVQSCADLLNHFGTYLDNGTDYSEWVGCPLLVHRRCISPMYEISNQISYGNIMKKQTMQPKQELIDSFIYEKSQWIDIKGKEKGDKNHFVEAQGRKVCEMLEIAFSRNSMPSLYIISPFASVVSGMRSYIKKYCKENRNTYIQIKENDWLSKNIGTVHTFQGKEANEVIFLLGCDGEPTTKGAILWVNENIVNVAVTRAKYRLYVVGDAEAWAKSSCVSTAKAILDQYQHD